jgi:hypothetical protein
MLWLTISSTVGVSAFSAAAALIVEKICGKLVRSTKTICASAGYEEDAPLLQRRLERCRCCCCCCCLAACG